MYGGSDSFGRRIFLYETVGRYQVLKKSCRKHDIESDMNIPRRESVGVSCLKRIAVSADAAAGDKMVRCDFFQFRIFFAANGFIAFIAAF